MSPRLSLGSVMTPVRKILLTVLTPHLRVYPTAPCFDCRGLRPPRANGAGSNAALLFLLSVESVPRLADPAASRTARREMLACSLDARPTSGSKCNCPTRPARIKSALRTSRVSSPRLQKKSTVLFATGNGALSPTCDKNSTVSSAPWLATTCHKTPPALVPSTTLGAPSRIVNEVSRLS